MSRCSLNLFIFFVDIYVLALFALRFIPEIDFAGMDGISVLFIHRVLHSKL